MATDRIVGQNLTGGPLALGAPVCFSGSSLVLASAVDASRFPAAGLVTEIRTQNLSIVAQIDGLLTLTNWFAVTGTTLLVPRAAYYLSDTPGKLTTNPSAASLVVQLLGLAATATTLEVMLPVVPNAGAFVSKIGLTQFYCADTGRFHTVKLFGNPSDWDIDPIGSLFPDPACLHAFAYYQYPCPDTGLWHNVQLTGTPPTWDIDPDGVVVPGVGIDLAFATQPVYNPDLKLWITVGLTGTPPTWGFALNTL